MYQSVKKKIVVEKYLSNTPKYANQIQLQIQIFHLVGFQIQIQIQIFAYLNTNTNTNMYLTPALVLIETTVLSLDYMIIIRTCGACAHGSLKNLINASLYMYTNSCHRIPKEIESWISLQTDLNITNYMYTLMTCGIPSQKASNAELLYCLWQ